MQREVEGQLVQAAHSASQHLLRAVTLSSLSMECLCLETKAPVVCDKRKGETALCLQSEWGERLSQPAKDSYVYGDEGAKSKHFARIRVKYKPYMSDKELYTRHYQYFLAWRGELLRAVRATRGQGQ